MVELLAPAGSEEAFYGAVHGGADAVYLAGDRFGARAYAENFTTETLLKCIRYGHLMGRKLYMAVNTLLKECELSDLYTYLRPFYEAGMDAVIVQDLGVFRFIRENFPGWKLHASTQMTLCSGYGASLLKEMGACRVVPARELGLRELILMKQQANVELETFIHGAMCYCYSGQCLFSSIVGGRSGNRGRCAQPCRLKYSVTAGKKIEGCYPLSLKDLCTIEHIPQLIEAGIDSFKIEGRMKKPEYAAGVTGIYRRYIDKYYELREKKGAEEAAEAYRVETDDQKFLRVLYIRSQVQDGYYFRHNGSEMITMDSPSYSGSDERVLSEIREKYIKTSLKLPVAVTARFVPGQPAEVTVRWQWLSASATGKTVEAAQKQPVTEGNVKKQLGKLGDSVFFAEEMAVDVGVDAFYPLGQINELRRDAVRKLEEQILQARGYKGGTTEGREQVEKPEGQSPSIRKRKCEAAEERAQGSGKIWVISVHTLPQLETVVHWLQAVPSVDPVRIYVEGDLIVQEWPAVSALCGRISARCAFWAVLPYVVRASDGDYLGQLLDKTENSKIFKGFLVRSLDGLSYVRQKGTLPCRVDAGVYVWNTSALQEIGHLAEGFCIPYELKASEQRCLLGQLPCEKIVYSRIPMMITANCLRRTVGQCKKGGGDAIRKDRYHAVLKDKYRNEFPVDINCLHCMNIIYNSVPFSLYREIPKWRDRVDLRMDFTLEPPEEVKELLDAFFWGKSLRTGEYTATTGHEKRGVE